MGEILLCLISCAIFSPVSYSFYSVNFFSVRGSSLYAGLRVSGKDFFQLKKLVCPFANTVEPQIMDTLKS